MPRALPADAHLKPPPVPDRNTVEECVEVLARGPVGDVLDAWLDERLSAMQAAAREVLREAVREVPG